MKLAREDEIQVLEVITDTLHIGNKIPGNYFYYVIIPATIMTECVCLIIIEYK